MRISGFRFTAFFGLTLCIAGCGGSDAPAPSSPDAPTSTAVAAPFAKAVRTASANYPGRTDVPAGTAVTFWASQPVNPAETVLVSAGNTNANVTVQVTRLDDSDAGDDPLTEQTSTNSGWVNVKPIQATEQSLKFQLPADATPGVFAYRISNESGLGATTLVNAPDVWFVQGDQGGTVSPGGKLNVYGTALHIAGGRARIALVDTLQNKSWIFLADIPTTDNDKEAGYAQTFSIPQGMPAGDYKLYVHNGYGGPSALTAYRNFGVGPDRSAPPAILTTITIAAPVAWPVKRCDVAPPKGNQAADDESFATAFDCAAEGGIVAIPAGRYTLSERYANGFGNTIPNHAVIEGDSMDNTVLSFPRATGTQANSLNRLVAGKIDYYASDIQMKCGTSGSWSAAMFGIRNLTIEAPVMVAGTAIHFDQMAPSDAHSVPFVRNVRLALGNESDRQANKQTMVGIAASRVSNLQITGNVITATKPIRLRDQVYGVAVTGNTLTWNEQALDFSYNTQNAVITHNTTISAGSPYPKTVVELGFAAPSKDVYYASNTSQYPDGDTPWGLTFDEGTGSYFQKVAAAAQQTLDLTKTARNIPGICDPDGESAMIVSGKGAGQMRYLLDTPRTDDPSHPVTRLNLDRAWDVTPDQSSVASVVTTNGRMLFVNNDYGGNSQVNNNYPTSDVIQANNRFSRGGASLEQIAGFYYTKHGLLPGWHVQFLNNEVTASASGGGDVTFKVQGSDRMILTDIKKDADDEKDTDNSWYTDSVTRAAVIRGNRYAQGVTGTVAVWDLVSNALVENNVVPGVELHNGHVKDTLIRGNRTADGQQPQIINQSGQVENGNLVQQP